MALIKRNLVNILVLAFAAALIVTAINTVRVGNLADAQKRDAKARQDDVCRIYTGVAASISRPADPKILQRSIHLIQALKLPGYQTPLAIKRATIAQVNDQLRRLGRPTDCPRLKSIPNP